MIQCRALIHLLLGGGRRWLDRLVPRILERFRAKVTLLRDVLVQLGRIAGLVHHIGCRAGLNLVLVRYCAEVLSLTRYVTVLSQVGVDHWDGSMRTR